jgi:hypothetical protein
VLPAGQRETGFEKRNSRMSTGGIVMPVFIGFLRRSDAAQRQGFAAPFALFRPSGTIN